MRATSTIYSEHVNNVVYLVSVSGKGKDILETAICSEVPHDLLEAFSHQWNYKSIRKIVQYPLIFGQAPQNNKQKNASPKIARIVRKNRQHERAHIILDRETTTTCTETGISYTVRLPTLYGTHLTTLHPLARIENCLELIRQCAMHGVYLNARYERQVLAGMLITILRNRGLLRCKDNIAGNLFLQRARGNILSLALNFLSELTSWRGFPSFSLLDVQRQELDLKLRNGGTDNPNAAKSLVELQILNWIRDCEAVQESVKKADEVQKRKAKSIRVYTDPIKREEKTNKDMQSVIRTHFLALEKLPNANVTTLTKLRFNIKTAEFVKTEQRTKIATWIRETWKDNADANAIAIAISGIENKATIEDLATLSDDLASDHNGHDVLPTTPKKLNLLGILANKLGQGKQQ